MGILKQIALEEDPYFSLYTSKLNMKIKYLNDFMFNDAASQQSQLIIKNVSIFRHSYVNFIDLSSLTSTRYLDLALFEIKLDPNLQVIIINFSVKDCQLPTAKNYLLFKFTNLTNILGKLTIDTLTVTNSAGIAIVKNSGLTHLDLNKVFLDNTDFNSQSPFSFSSSSSVIVNNMIVDRCSSASFSLKFLE